MSIKHESGKRQQVLFWGMNGVYSQTVLEILLQANVNIAAVIVDRSAVPIMDGSLPYEEIVPPSPTISPADELEISLGSAPYLATNTINMAWQHGLPVYALERLTAPESIKLLTSLNAGIACVACFPRRIPQALLAMPKHGFLNVHPSRLPDYRGPAPLFWQLRDGTNPLSITVHWMHASLDTGDVAAQIDVMLPDGINGPSANQRLAKVGGDLLVDVLDSVEQGKERHQAQQEGGSYQPWPLAEDFRLDPAWPARRAFNFMRGTAEWGLPYPLTIGDEEVVLRHALDFWPQQQLSMPVLKKGRQMHIQFASGVLVAGIW